MFKPRRHPDLSDEIAIFTTDNYKKGIKELFKHFVFKNGYDKSKKYYTSAYGYNNEDNFQEIDWKPNLITNELGEVVFKIKKNKTNRSYLFCIQGFTEEGQLISDVITMD